MFVGLQMGLILMPTLSIVYYFNCKGNGHSENVTFMK